MAELMLIISRHTSNKKATIFNANHVLEPFFRERIVKSNKFYLAKVKWLPHI